MIVGIGGTHLPSLALSGKTEIVELSAERRKGRVVKVLGQYRLFDLKSVVDNNLSQSSLFDRAGDKGDDAGVLLEHIHQASEERRRRDM